MGIAPGGIDVAGAMTFVGALLGVGIAWFGLKQKKLGLRVSALELLQKENQAQATIIDIRDKTIQSKDDELVATKAARDAEIADRDKAISDLRAEVEFLKGKLDQFEKFMASPQSILDQQTKNTELIVQAFGALKSEFLAMRQETKSEMRQYKSEVKSLCQAINKAMLKEAR